MFPKAGGFQLSGSADADFNGDPDERLSTSGITIDFGGALILASSRTQKWASKSVGQSEHGALAQLAAEILFYKRALDSLQIEQGVTTATMRDSVELSSDSNVAMAAANRPANWQSDKFKHIESHRMFWHQYVRSKVLTLVKVPSEINSADLLTKNFDSAEKFQALANMYMKEMPIEHRKCM